jgi:hypothetical protein
MKNKVSKPAKALFTIGAIIAIVSATIFFKSYKGCTEEIPSYMYPFIEECTRHEIKGEIEKEEDYILEEEP